MALSNPVTVCGGTSAKAVTPSDTAAFPPSVIYVGVTGNVNAMPADQERAASPTAVVFKGVPAGSTLPVLAIQVFSTSTTATDIVRIS